MKRFRILLPLANAVLFLVVAAAYIATHGGWKGDAEPYVAYAVGGPADLGLVFFNRWTFSDAASPLTYFMSLNLPSFVVAMLVLRILGAVSQQFQGPQPFGLSYGSYSLILALALSVLQWFGVGVILDRVRERARRARAGRLGRGTTGAPER